MLKSFSLTIAIALNVLNQTTLRPVKLLPISRENYLNTSLLTHTITEPDLKLHNQGFSWCLYVKLGCCMVNFSWKLQSSLLVTLKAIFKVQLKP